MAEAATSEFASSEAEAAAKAAGLSASDIKGTGADHAIKKGDVDRAVAARKGGDDRAKARTRATASDSGSKPSEKELVEERHAAAVASTQGAVPPPSVPEPEPTKDEQKKREAAQEVVDDLVDLPFDQLTRLRGAVDHALTLKGTEPVTAGPSLEEVSGSLAVNRELSKTTSKGGVTTLAKHFDDVDSDQIIGYAVRQAYIEATEEFVGPAYLRVSLVDGTKRAVKL